VEPQPFESGWVDVEEVVAGAAAEVVVAVGVGVVELHSLVFDDAQ